MACRDPRQTPLSAAAVLGRGVAHPKRAEALRRLGNGDTRPQVCESLGVSQSALSKWLAEERERTETQEGDDASV